MTYGEFEKRILGILEKPDTALAAIKPLLDDVKVDYEQIITLSEAKEKSDARIRDLQDTNMKLFLMQTCKVDHVQDDEEELEGQAATEAFIKKINKEEE